MWWSVFCSCAPRAYEGVSFVEAMERTKYDLRWKVALGLDME